jgi:hypothetical protein
LAYRFVTPIQLDGKNQREIPFSVPVNLGGLETYREHGKTV